MTTYAGAAVVVIVNALGQHSLWRDEQADPPGWRRVSAALTEAEGLAAVERSWRTLAPVTLGNWEEAHGGGPVHEAFAALASRQPAALAVSAGQAQVTYGELDEGANRLAHYLAGIGAAPETVIGVHLDPGTDVIRVILAIMKAGAAYLPLDRSFPAERLAAICARAQPAAVITADPVPFAAEGTLAVPLDELDSELELLPATAPAVRPAPGNLCYVIHTSGTSGDPKAVAVSYGSLACTVPVLARQYQTSPADRVGQLASLAFDTSIEQIFTALTSGAALIMPPPGTLAPSGLLRLIHTAGITVIDLTPAYWHPLLKGASPSDPRLRSVRLMITGGEAANPADCAAALRAAPWARLLNAYGLTETTITSAVHDIGIAAVAADAAVPAGRPVGHTRITIVDNQLRPVPDGQPGEICIGGCGVARGYLGQPALTAARFVPDPGGSPGARMYRTGDRGRWQDSGALEVTGRIDRQLKVRGFRVDPAEIEGVLAAYPGITQVSVTADRSGAAGTRLAACYTISPAARESGTPSSPAPADLRRYLRDRLPGYMIPSSFTATGDLAPPPGPAATGQPAEAGHDSQHQPLTAGQAAITSLWARLLGADHVGLDDDFFDLGGDSLLTAEMLAHASAIFGLPPDSTRALTLALLDGPSPRAFAAAVEAARTGQLASCDQDADFAGDAELGVTIARPAPKAQPPQWRAPREVLLTGATGFVGAHLMHEVTARTAARVWCLARARDAAEALERINAAAARYNLPAPPAGRVMPLPGDLAEPFLGLAPATFRALADTIDVIYHAGARVNFIYPYRALRAANVGGTREVIRLAGLSRGIPVHYVSSTAVLASLGTAGTREAAENTPPAHPERLRMGYAQTKYVAENLLRAASRAGLPVAIYRPLDVVGSLAAGAWPTTGELAAVTRFITDTGLTPDIDLPLDLVAADVCAQAIRHISLTRQPDGRVYHLAGPGRTSLRDLAARLRDHGYKITEVPFSNWIHEIARTAATSPAHPMTAFLPLFIDRDPASGLTVAEMYLGHVFPVYSQANTERALRGSGVVFGAGRPLLDRNISRLVQTGYLPAPPGGGGTASARSLRSPRRVP